MYDRNSIKLINQTILTRRIAFVFILLALALPSLFVWSDHGELANAGQVTAKLVAVTLLALMARLWLARHYSPGVQAQVLLIFALVLLGWSGYVSRIAHEERLSAMAHPASTMSSHIPGQVWNGAGR